jgi:prolipoprotein diacylglyceryltransferase
LRKRARPAGHLFRYYLITYAILRIGLEWVRDDGAPALAGAVTPAQVFCAVAALVLLYSLRAARQELPQRPELQAKRI